MQSYRELIVWQKSIDLVTELYKITLNLPKSELYCLTSQIRRSCISIPSNIAEGYGRNSTNDYIRFLQIAVGSLYEFQTQLLITKNLKYIPQILYDDLHSKTYEIEKMLNSLITKIKNSKR